jgi:serine/threonine-protein kinase
MLKSIYEKRAAALAEKGDFEGAAKWYERAGNAEAAAEMEIRAGHLQQGFAILERLGKLDRAAQTALAMKDYRRASQYLSKSGDHGRAVEVLIEGREHDAAIQLCIDQGMKARAAELCLERGHKARAAALYLELGDSAKAVELFRQTGNMAKVVAAYKAAGREIEGADECKALGEHVTAAQLYELGGKPADAAGMYREAGNLEKAAALYEQCGELARYAELQQEAGRLDLAAAAYEKVPGLEIEAANRYAKLVVLQPVAEKEFEDAVQLGAASEQEDGTAIILRNRNFLLASRSLEQRWQSRLTGRMTPSALAISEDAKLVAIGTDAPAGTSERKLLVYDATKQLVLQKEFDEPVKQVVFLPGDGGMLVAVGDGVLSLTPEGGVRWEAPVEFRAWALDLSPKGDRIAVGTLGGHLLVLDMDGKKLIEEDLGERLPKVRFNADGTQIVAAAGDAHMVFFDPEFGKQKEITPGDRIRVLELLPGRELIAVAVGSDLLLYDWEGAGLSRVTAGNAVTTMFSDPIALQLRVATDDKKLRSYRADYFRQQAAEWYTKAGKLKEAAAIYEEVEAFDKAYELFRELGNYEDAARVVQATGDVVRAARHYEVIGQFDRAAKLYETSGEMSLAARSYGKAGELEKAADLYEKLGDQILAADYHEQSGNNKAAARIFRNTNQAERAITNYESWLLKEPDDPEVIFDLGVMYSDGGRQDEAIRLMQKLTENPDRRREALRILGECFLAKQLPDVAIDRFKEAIGPADKPGKDNIDLYYNIGIAHEQASRFDEATEVFSKVMAIDYYYRDIQERLNQSRMYQSMATQAGKQPALKEFDFDEGATRQIEAEPEGFKRYRILKKLGQGGMGVVYLAMDERLGRQVAWKVLPSNLSGDKEFQMRLLREARAVAQVQNRHIVSIYDIVTSDQECYITMEFIDGTTLRHKLRETPQLPLPDMLRHALEMSEGLGVAHRAGIVHRDMKPENIMLVSETGDVKVVDFGLARLGEESSLTREGVIAGTVAYMAPEQITAKPPDNRVDIYALGVIMFEMLAGRQAFIGENVLAQHLHAEIPKVEEFRDETPPELATLIYQCLQKDRDARPQDCGEIHDRLRALQNTVSNLSTRMF